LAVQVAFAGDAERYCGVTDTTSFMNDL
jgi:hypothetical protein